MPRKRGTSLTLDVGLLFVQSQLSYIACKGRFSDGNEIGEKGANFNTTGKYPDAAH
jgi:hypothetical protein